MKKKLYKSILLIMPYGSVGGMERLALSFYSFYKNNGYSVKALKFIKLENDIISFDEDEIFLSDKDFSFMSKKDRMLFYLKTPKKINRIVKKYNVTHSISFGDMANLFSSLSFSGEYKIGSIHALKSIEFKHKTFFNKITNFGYKSSYKNLNKLVCISKAIKKDLIENCGYRFSNLEIIYNPHDIQSIINLSNEPLTDKYEINIFSKKTILFLGRMSIQKSPWHFIKAFKLVIKDLPETNLVLIGDGDKKVTEYLNKLIKNLNLEDHIYLLGRRSNPYKYLKNSDTLVLSSNYEGTPNVIVESIAVGTPIVSSYCTKGVIELMSLNDYDESFDNIDTETGIVTPNLFRGKLEIPSFKEGFLTEEKQLAEALKKILTTNKYKISLEKNRKQLLNKFDLQEVSLNYLKQI